MSPCSSEGSRPSRWAASAAHVQHAAGPFLFSSRLGLAVGTPTIKGFHLGVGGCPAWFPRDGAGLGASWAGRVVPPEEVNVPRATTPVQQVLGFAIAEGRGRALGCTSAPGCCGCRSLPQSQGSSGSTCPFLVGCWGNGEGPRGFLGGVGCGCLPPVRAASSSTCTWRLQP